LAKITTMHFSFLRYRTLLYLLSGGVSNDVTITSAQCSEMIIFGTDFLFSVK